MAYLAAHFSIDALLFAWVHNGEHAQRLIEDLAEDRITRQPDGLIYHPAWTIHHLIHYHPAILGLALNEPFDDPGDLPKSEWYDANSTPVDDPTQYPSKAQLLEDFAHGHELVRSALEKAPDDLLEQPPSLERWVQTFTTTGRALTYLMCAHEALHLGQIVAWRYAMNLPAVAAMGDGEPG